MTRDSDEGRQYGFYVDDETTSLKLRPQKGDVMIKPPEKPRKKHRRKTPFQEVVDYENALRDRSDQIGVHELETDTGGEAIIDVGRHDSKQSNVGEPGGRVTRHTKPPLAALPELSPAAKGLFRKRNAQQTAAPRPCPDSPESRSSDSGSPPFTNDFDALPHPDVPGTNVGQLGKIATLVLDTLRKKRS